MLVFTNSRQILSQLSEIITLGPLLLELNGKYFFLSEGLPLVARKGAACSIDPLKTIIYVPCSEFHCSLMFLVKVLFNSRDISRSLKLIHKISLVCSLEVNYHVPLFAKNPWEALRS